jgi:hypothetical protein
MPRIAADDASGIAAGVEAIHGQIREVVTASMTDDAIEGLRAVDDTQSGDTIYAIDRVGDSSLLEIVAEYLAPWLPVLVVAEGLPDIGHGAGVAVVPKGAAPMTTRFRVVIDPIDGTRGLMYGKRSAWILTGVAAHGGPAGMTPTLLDIDVAVQTEIPPPKQFLADTLRAVRGGGASATRTKLHTGETRPFDLSPSAAETIAHGFGQVMRAFPGGRDLLAAIDDDICCALLGPGQTGKAGTFEDQYISTGGQLAELAFGHDRWIADLRPLLAPVLGRRGQPPLLCCHPYDICTALIAQEAGVLVTGLDGEPLSAPLVVDADVAWVAYSNERIRSLVEPALLSAVHRHGLVP